MTQFTTSPLVDGRVLVQGEDSHGSQGSTTVDGSQWAEINRRDEFSQANDDFDRAVEEFFKPLTDAAEERERALTRPTDPIAYVVLHEGTSGVPAQDEQLVKLSKDSMILRIIEEGQTDRLVWVEDSLEILEVLPGAGSQGSTRSAKAPAKKKAPARKR